VSGIKLGVAWRHKTRKTEVAQLADGGCLLIDDILRLQVAVYDADADSHVRSDVLVGAKKSMAGAASASGQTGRKRTQGA